MTIAYRRFSMRGCYSAQNNFSLVFCQVGNEGRSDYRIARPFVGSILNGCVASRMGRFQAHVTIDQKHGERSISVD
jgi:hypothetical protein